jgi:hypothetical protein
MPIAMPRRRVGNPAHLYLGAAMNLIRNLALLLGSLATFAVSGGVWSATYKITKLQVLNTSTSPGSAVPATPVCLVELNNNTNTTFLLELNGQVGNDKLFDLLVAAKSVDGDVSIWYDPLITLSSNTQTANGTLVRPRVIAASFNPVAP